MLFLTRFFAQKPGGTTDPAQSQGDRPPGFMFNNKRLYFELGVPKDAANLETRIFRTDDWKIVGTYAIDIGKLDNKPEMTGFSLTLLEFDDSVKGRPEELIIPGRYTAAVCDGINEDRYFKFELTQEDVNHLLHEIRPKLKNSKLAGALDLPAVQPHQEAKQPGTDQVKSLAKMSEPVDRTTSIAAVAADVGTSADGASEQPLETIDQPEPSTTAQTDAPDKTEVAPQEQSPASTEKTTVPDSRLEQELAQVAQLKKELREAIGQVDELYAGMNKKLSTLYGSASTFAVDSKNQLVTFVDNAQNMLNQFGRKEIEIDKMAESLNGFLAKFETALADQTNKAKKAHDELDELKAAFQGENKKAEDVLLSLNEGNRQQIAEFKRANDAETSSLRQSVQTAIDAAKQSFEAAFKPHLDKVEKLEQTLTVQTVRTNEEEARLNGLVSEFTTKSNGALADCQNGFQIVSQAALAEARQKCNELFKDQIASCRSDCEAALQAVLAEAKKSFDKLIKEEIANIAKERDRMVAEHLEGLSAEMSAKDLERDKAFNDQSRSLGEKISEANKLVGDCALLQAKLQEQLTAADESRMVTQNVAASEARLHDELAEVARLKTELETMIRQQNAAQAAAANAQKGAEAAQAKKDKNNEANKANWIWKPTKLIWHWFLELDSKKITNERME